ncbi:MAG: glycosyltransferase family 4 protein [Ekhidna sp.]
MQSLLINSRLQKFVIYKLQRVKIAFVANTCWNIYNFRKGLVHHFLEKGDEIIVLAPKDEYTTKLQSWGVQWLDTPLDGTGVNPVKDLVYLSKIQRVFSKERPDVALSFTIKSNIYASLAGKLSGVPVICNVSGLGTVFLVKGTSGKAAIMLYKLAFRFASHIFFQNEDDQKLFLSKVPLRQGRFSMLPGSGINLNDYPFSKKRPSGQLKLLMISRLIIEKGVREFATMCAAFNGDHRVSFTLVGRFDENHARTISKAELEGWISNGWLTYHPHTDKIVDMVQEHDAVVLPSYREGTSRTLLEGAALGRPLIATDVPGCREVVEDGVNGFLCKRKDADSLTQKVRLFLSLSHDERETMAMNSRRLVEAKFDEKIVIETYDSTIRQITAST